MNKNENIKRIAIIPARGGSKRIPDKNIRDFCGKPMISYILETAKRSGLFDTIHVSTDSERISDEVSKLGYEIDFMRPDNLADDNTPIMPVLKYVVESYRKRGKEFEQVFLLMACSPLIESNDLIDASKLLTLHDSKKAVLGISPYPAPIEWAFERADGGKLIPVQPGMFSVRSQDLKEKYYDAGMFCAFPAHIISNTEGAGSDDEFLGKILPKYKAVDIDDEEDWQLAEALYKGIHNI